MKQPDLSKALLALSIAVALFLSGMVVGHLEMFPLQALQFGWTSLGAVVEERDTLLKIRPAELLRRARYEGRGVTKGAGRDDRITPGLMFMAGLFGDAKEMRLMRLDGSILRRWAVEFAKIFPNPDHIQPPDQIPQSEWNTELHGALVLPDGSVVFNFEGAGLAKLDKCGTVQWALPRMTHHSVERAEGGGFWVSGRRRVTDATSLPFRLPFNEALLTRVSDDGEVVRDISVPELLMKNHLEAQLLVRTSGFNFPRGDIVHLNDVEELSAALAPRFPMFAAGDLLVSLRELNMILVVDPAAERVKWHQVGPWIGQHDPEFRFNGRIAVFSNHDDETPTGSVMGGSRIFEVDPMTGETRILYGGSPSQHFFTSIRGKLQTFDNGNLLITEADAGRVLEVDSKGELVWEYVNRYDDEEVGVISEARRYPEEYFTVTDWACDGDSAQ